MRNEACFRCAFQNPKGTALSRESGGDRPKVVLYRACINYRNLLVGYNTLHLSTVSRGSLRCLPYIVIFKFRTQVIVLWQQTTYIPSSFFWPSKSSSALPGARDKAPSRVAAFVGRLDNPCRPLNPLTQLSQTLWYNIYLPHLPRVPWIQILCKHGNVNYLCSTYFSIPRSLHPVVLQRPCRV